MEKGKEYGDQKAKKHKVEESLEEDSDVVEDTEDYSEEEQVDFEEEKPKKSFWEDDDIEEEAQEKKNKEDSEDEPEEEPEDEAEEDNEEEPEEDQEEDSEDEEKDLKKEVKKEPKKIEKKPKEQKTKALLTWQVLTVILAVLLIVSIYTNGFKFGATGVAAQSEKTTAQTQPTTDVKRVQVSADDDPVKGPANAKVTIIEFSDYQCPFCSKAETTIDQITKTYGNDVKVVFRDFPLGFHQYAQKAAEASQCANEQGKFWEYNKKLFANQGALNISNLKAYAVELKLNSAKFNQCLDSGKYEQEVKKDIEDGKAAGVSGTPAFFINGRLVSGAQPFESFKKIIDEELK